ncbi:hypothetical protein K3495_g10784 [Podosphaera aphanis]|nr:hypothetical protein K3495_g10784 [Podosphaera aphanis]
MYGRSPALERWNSREMPLEIGGPGPEIAGRGDRVRSDVESRLPNARYYPQFRPNLPSQLTSTSCLQFNEFQEAYPPKSPSKNRIPLALKFESKNSLTSDGYRDTLFSPSQAKSSLEPPGNTTRPKPSVGYTKHWAISQNDVKVREIDLVYDHESEVSSICHSPGWDDLSGKKSKEKRAKKRKEKEQRERVERERTKFDPKGRPILLPIKQREKEQRKINEKMKNKAHEKPLSRPKKLSKLPPKDNKKIANFRSNSDPLVHYQNVHGREMDSITKLHRGRESDDAEAKTALLPLSPLNISPVLHTTSNQEQKFIGGLKLRKVEEANVQDAIKKIRVRDQRESKIVLPQMLNGSDTRNIEPHVSYHSRFPYIQGPPIRSPRSGDQFFTQMAEIEGNSYEVPVFTEDIPTRASMRGAHPSNINHINNELDKLDKAAEASKPADTRNTSHHEAEDMNVQPLSFNKSGQRLNSSHQLRRQSIHIHDYVKGEFDPSIEFEMAQKSPETPDERVPSSKARGFHGLIQDIKALRSFTENIDYSEPSRKLESTWHKNDSQRRSTPESTINSHSESLSKAERVLGETISTLLVENFVEKRPFSGSTNSIRCIDPGVCIYPSGSTTTPSEEDSTYEELSNITSPIVSRPHSMKDRSPERISTEMPRIPPHPDMPAEDDALSCSVYSNEIYLEDQDRLNTPSSATSEKLSATARLSGTESPITLEERRQESPRRNLISDSYFLPKHVQPSVAWPPNENARNSRGLIRKPPRPKESNRPPDSTGKKIDSSDYLRKARKNISPPNSSPGSPRSLRNKYLAQKIVDPFAKMFVVCCSCKYFHDLPSKVYACMAGPGDVVTEKNLGVSGVMTTSVECPWCGHGMTTTCCAGYAAIVYMKERLH